MKSLPVRLFPAKGEKFDTGRGFFLGWQTLVIHRDKCWWENPARSNNKLMNLKPHVGRAFLLVLTTFITIIIRSVEKKGQENKTKTRFVNVYVH